MGVLGQTALVIDRQGDVSKGLGQTLSQNPYWCVSSSKFSNLLWDMFWSSAKWV